jgi:translocator protein
MTVAAWRLLRLPPEAHGRNVALALFFAQLALNAAWPWTFFVAHSFAFALLNIVPQWLLLIATIDAMCEVDLVAAMFMFPVAAWVAFCGLMTASIWLLNT